MFANLLFKFAGKLLGPRVLMGVAVAAIAAAAVLGWMNMQNLREAAQANQRLVQIERALADTNSELENALDERDRLNAALNRKHDREKISRARARKAEAALAELEASSEDDANWADARVPADIVGWLRDGSGPGD